MTKLHHLFELETDLFPGTAPRPDAINELIGGDELAAWLHERLVAEGLGCGDVYAEDHGWDFEVTQDKRRYLIVSSCDFDDEDETTQEHSVQVAQLKGEAVNPDPVLDMVRAVLRAAPEIELVGDEAVHRR